jgi:WD40 repeat protein
MSISLDPDELFFLASGNDGSIRLWSVDPCECLVVYKGHINTVWK